jgi:hypothetical protein
MTDGVAHVSDLHGLEAAFDRLRRGDGARTVVVLDPAAGLAAPSAVVAS